MATDPPSTYVYEDPTLGPAEPLVVETSPEVFQPTTTTRLLLRAVRRHVQERPRSALDLGCGCGVVALALRRFLVPAGRVGASDLSSRATALAARNAARLELEIDVRCGSLFEPWAGERFDLIVDDIAAVAEPIARSSPWYPPAVPSEAGDDGTRWIRAVLMEAPKFLEAGGRLVFPVLTLSDQTRVLEEAGRRFGRVELLEEEWYPIGPELGARLDLLDELAARGTIEIRRRGSRRIWATKVYAAADPRS